MKCDHEEERVAGASDRDKPGDDADCRARSGAPPLRVVAWFVAVGSACYAFFLVVAFHGLAVDTWAQVHRQLQIESVAASGLLVLDRLGLYNATIVAGNPGSIDLGGSLPNALGTLSSVVQVCAAVGVALALTRGRLSPQRLATAATAEVLAFAVFGKVLSPQFLIWLVPLVPLVAGLGGLVATLLLPLALLATQIELEGYSGLHIAGYSVVLLAIRNVLLLVLFGAVAREVLHGARTSEVARLR